MPQPVRDRRLRRPRRSTRVSPDFYGKRFPFIDLDKGETNQGPDSSALGVLRAQRRR